jgi:hypothetical protein
VVAGFEIAVEKSTLAGASFFWHLFFFFGLINSSRFFFLLSFTGLMVPENTLAFWKTFVFLDLKKKKKKVGQSSEKLRMNLHQF